MSSTQWELAGSFLSTGDLSTFLSHVDFPVLFSALADDLPSKDRFYQTLEAVFSRNGNLLLEELAGFVIQGINKENNNEELRRFSMKELQKVMKEGGNGEKFMESGLFEAVFELLVDESLWMAQNASKLLRGLIETDRAMIVAVLKTKKVSNLLENWVKSDPNGEISLRITEFCCQIAALDSDLFNWILTSEISYIVRDLFTMTTDFALKDPMYALNALELATELIKTNHGYKFADSVDFSKSLRDLVPVPFLLNGCLIAVELLLVNGLSSSECVLWQRILSTELVKPGPIQTNCIFSMGKISVLLQSEPDPSWKVIVSYISGANMDLKIASIHALCEVIPLESYRSLFTSIGGSDIHSMIILFSLLKAPFVDQRSAVFRLLTVIGKFSWGLVTIRDTPGLVEWLLNRSTESDLVGNDWKYSVIQVIVQNSYFEELNLNHQLKVYYKLGRVYRDKEADVEVYVS